MNSNKTKVLVFGDDTQSFLATVRSLGRKGVQIHVVPQDFRSPALRSRYIQKIHRLPPYRGEGADWLAALTGLLNAERFDLVMPCIDAALLPLSRFRAELEPLCRIAMPSEQAIKALFDKMETRKLAQRLEIPVAQGMLFAAGDDPDAALDRIGLPLVLKPKRSFHLENLYVRNNVQVLFTREEALSELAQLSEPEMLLESFFHGASVGLSVLAINGEVLQFFQHIRVHPSKNGNSGYRKSMALDPGLVAGCSRLVADLDYTGLVMCEFRQDPDSGRWVLLECNARPWGSMPLPVSLGVDFPYWWMKLLLEGERAPGREYPAGHFARNLTTDAYYLAEQIKSAAPRRLRQIGVALRWMGGFGRRLIGIEASDTLVRDDPRPAFAEWRNLWSRVERKAFGRNARDAQELVRLELARAAAAPRGALHIEFVCLGNICRSPYAERLLRRLLPDDLSPRVSIGSSGSLLLEGRTSPVEVIERAQLREGIDLTPHRSRYLTQEIMGSASLLVVFEERNEERVLDLYPDAQGKLLWLGDFIEDARRGLRIDDPFGKGGPAYDRAFGLIEVAVKGMVSALARAIPAQAEPQLVRSL